MNTEYLMLKLETMIPQLTRPIIDRHYQSTTANRKHDGSIVTEADLELQKCLTESLHQLAPDIIMLGEEMTAQQQQQVIQSGKPYWCLDPLDGTNNFHHEVPLFSVSLAMVDQGQLALGIVFDPVRQEIFSAHQNSPLRLNGEPVVAIDQPTELGRCLASVDFKRLKPDLRMHVVSGMPFKSQRNVGSCALEWAWLAAGRTQLLLHGGEKLWDYAAGCLLLDRAGGKSTTLEKQTVFNNSLENRSIVATSQASLHQDWQEFLTNH